MFWNEFWAEHWLTKFKETMDRCTDQRNVTEILNGVKTQNLLVEKYK